MVRQMVKFAGDTLSGLFDARSRHKQAIGQNETPTCRAVVCGLLADMGFQFRGVTKNKRGGGFPMALKVGRPLQVAFPLMEFSWAFSRSTRRDFALCVKRLII